MLNEFFIYVKTEMINCVYAIFNKVLNLGIFLDSWSEGFIVPLHKKGSINNPTNYRGITLLSTLGKLFTHIISNRLDNSAEHYFVYIEAQAGFRKKMGTVDNIFCTSWTYITYD